MKATYQEGMDDGLKGLPPRLEVLCLGCNSLNDYEKGYVDLPKVAQK